MKKAIDISNWQGDLASSVFEAWKAEGIQTVICGTDGAPPLFVPQADKAIAAGLNTEAYIYLYFGQGGAAYDVVGRTEGKLDLIGTVPGIKRVWIDCEDTSSGLQPADIVALIAGARDAVQARGYECGIYTGRWFWVPYTAGEKGFWDLDLWHADYTTGETLDMEPFGGWNVAYRHQYTDKGMAGGISPLDLNVENDIKPAVEPVQDEYLRGRTDAINAMQAALDALKESK